LPVEFLSELENKVETLLLSLEETKDENTILKQSKEQSNEKLKELNARIEELEGENKNLKDQLHSLKTDADGQQEKINVASERIQGILAKLEAAR